MLIHGFGASVYHWRYNIPALAEKHPVYALDLLGFGWSSKALIDYGGGDAWVAQAGTSAVIAPAMSCHSLSSVLAQVSKFLEEKVGSQPAVLVGNSLGGFVSLATAAARPDLVKGVVLINGAGRFEEDLPAGSKQQGDTESPEPSGLQR